MVWIYAAHVGGGLGGILLRGAFAGLFLLPPTILMGATLPAIARWVKATPTGISWLGLFYSGNIAGAVFGSLLAGFYLLRIHDSIFASFVAVAINILVALMALILSIPARYEAQTGTERLPGAVEESFVVSRSRANPWLVYLIIALSGMAALGGEVIWTRLLSLLLGGTVYTFSIILAVFLFGLGIGSAIGAALARGNRPPMALLCGCQWLLAAAIAWTSGTLGNSLPYHWPLDSLTSDAWLGFKLDLAHCLWILLPATVLWGASFPLALAAARGHDSARLVGGVYAANTVGGIFGGICFSIIFIPVLGTQHSQQLLVGISTLAALLAFAAIARKCWKTFPSALGGAVILATLILVPAMIADGIAKVPGGLVAYGRKATITFGYTTIYVGEGMNNTVAVTRDLKDNIRNFHVSGKVEASSDPQDMRLQRMLGDIPAMIHPQVHSVLVVGGGAGVTAGSFTVLPDIKQITICELEPLVPKVAAQYFGAENYGVMKDPRTQIIYDDARHYILTTHDKFDVITSDPIHPWVKGSATLYTKEYFELVKARLNPGGGVTQWVPLYESDANTVKSEIATFFEVFPDGTIWSNDQKGKGYDLILLGQVGPAKINLDDINARLAQPEYAGLANSLRQVGFNSAFDVFATYIGQSRDLAPWLENAPINRDRNLRLQYLAGLSINWENSEGVYKNIIAYRRFPDALFTGSDESLKTLEDAMAKTGPIKQ
jgi:spermidine synthase